MSVQVSTLPDLGDELRKMPTTVLAGRAEKLWGRLPEEHQAWVTRVIDLHEAPFTATRNVGLRSMPRTKAVSEIVTVLRELRRRDPITDPRWIAQRYRELFNKAQSDGQYEVARKCLTDLAHFEGHIDKGVTVNVNNLPEIRDISPENLEAVSRIYREMRGLNAPEKVVSEQ